MSLRSNGGITRLGMYSGTLCFNETVLPLFPPLSSCKIPISFCQQSQHSGGVKSCDPVPANMPCKKVQAKKAKENGGGGAGVFAC